MPSFEKEKGRVVLLMRRLGPTPDGYRVPNTTAASETGADVIALIDGRRIGIQVTDLDTGEAAGAARAAEARLSRDAVKRDTTYGTWAQNDPDKIMDAIVRSVARKALMSFAGFDEFWLLICAGVPELGGIGATSIMTPWLIIDALDAAISRSLAASKYTRAFIHVILGPEQNALYQWGRARVGQNRLYPWPLRSADRTSGITRMIPIC